MQSPAQPLQIESNLTGTKRMTIDAANPEMYKLLFKSMYQYPEMAVLREIGSNGEDSHFRAGCPDRAIEVTLPTWIEPVLTIRDYGTSMTDDVVMGMFAEAGGSDKRDDNTQTGRFGIGSKSPFTITDAFTMICYLDGMARSYMIAFDADELPGITPIDNGDGVYETPTDEENGVEFIIPTEQHRVDAFQKFAPIVAMAFEVPFMDPPEHEVHAQGDFWKVIDIRLWGNHRNFVQQGSCFYPIPSEWIEDLESPLNGNDTLIVEVPLGTANIGPDRESLGNDEISKSNVRDFVYTAFEDIRFKVLEQVEDAKGKWLTLCSTVSTLRRWVTDSTIEMATGQPPRSFSYVYFQDDSTREWPVFQTGKHFSGKVTRPSIGRSTDGKLLHPLAALAHRSTPGGPPPGARRRSYMWDVAHELKFLLRRPGTTYINLRVLKFCGKYGYGTEVHVLDNPSPRLIARMHEQLGVPWENFIECEELPFIKPKPRTRQQRAESVIRGVNLCTANGTAPVHEIPAEYLWVDGSRTTDVHGNAFVERTAIAKQVAELGSALNLGEITVISFTELAQERFKPDPARRVDTFFAALDKSDIKVRAARAIWASELNSVIENSWNGGSPFDLTPEQKAALTGIDVSWFRKTEIPGHDVLQFCGFEVSRWSKSDFQRSIDSSVGRYMHYVRRQHPMMFSKKLSNELFNEYLSQNYTPDTGITPEEEN